MDIEIFKNLGFYLLDKLLDFLFEKGMKKLHWKTIFYRAKKNVLTGADAEQFKKDFESIITKKEIRKLEKDIKKAKGYDYEKIVRSNLTKVFVDNGIADLPEGAVRFLTDCITDQIKHYFPDSYQEYYLAETRKNLTGLLTSVKDSVKELLPLKQLLNEGIETGDDVEEKIRKNQKKQVTLWYFDIDDWPFLERFDKSFPAQDLHTSRSIYINCGLKEEAAYQLMAYLSAKKDVPLSSVLAVRKKEAWERLRKMHIENRVLIPLFNSEAIYQIPNNINIFLYSEDEGIKDALTLRHREKANIVRSLERCGFSIEEAENIFTKTSGNYILMQDFLFHGKFTPSKYRIASSLKEIIELAVLFGGWKDQSDGPLLFGASYNKIRSKINQNYSKAEVSLFTRKFVRGEPVYQVTSVDKALKDLYPDMGEEAVDRFVARSKELLLGDDASAFLKRSIVKTILSFKYNLSLDENRPEWLEGWCADIFGSEDFRHLSPVIDELTELSPNGYLSLFKEPFSSALKEYLLKEDGTYVLFPMRLLMRNENLAFRVVTLLYRLLDLNLHKSNREFIAELFTDSLTPAFSCSALTDNEKLKIAAEAIKDNGNNWECVFRNVSLNRSVTVSVQYLLYSRSCYPDPEPVPVRRFYKLYCAYYSLCVSAIDGDPKKIRKILLISRSVPYDNFKEAYDHILKQIQLFNDPRKADIRSEILSLVYKHRLFSEASSWKMDEKFLRLFSQLAEDIRFDESIYRERYVFENPEFPISDPAPYESPDYGRINEQKRKQLIEQTLNGWKKEGVALSSILQMYGKEKCTFGEYAASYMDDGKYSEGTLSLLLGNGNEDILLDYIVSVVSNDDKVLSAVVPMLEGKVSPEFIAEILRLKDVGENVPLIDKSSEEVKRKFWNSTLRFWDPLSKDTVRWVMDNLIRYGNAEGYCQFVEKQFKTDMDSLYHSALRLKEIKKDKYSPLDTAFVNRLLDRVRPYVFKDRDRINKIADIEFQFFPQSEEELPCFRYRIEHDPRDYLMYLKLWYEKDHPDKKKKLIQEEQEYRGSLYSFYSIRFRFCPGKEGNTISEKVFYDWVKKFKTGLKEQDQSSLFSICMGKLIANSPAGKDGLSPHEVIRNFIEENSDEDLRASYCVSIMNRRGWHEIKGGRNDFELYQAAEENAGKLDGKWPETARIYKLLAEEYKRDSEFERANYGE